MSLMFFPAEHRSTARDVLQFRKIVDNLNGIKFLVSICERR